MRAIGFGVTIPKPDSPRVTAVTIDTADETTEFSAETISVVACDPIASVKAPNWSANLADLAKRSASLCETYCPDIAVVRRADPPGRQAANRKPGTYLALLACGAVAGSVGQVVAADRTLLYTGTECAEAYFKFVGGRPDKPKAAQELLAGTIGDAEDQIAALCAALTGLATIAARRPLKPK